MVPVLFGNRYACGHIHKDQRKLVVSGGIGCLITQVRFGVSPEIIAATLKAGARALVKKVFWRSLSLELYGGFLRYMIKGWAMCRQPWVILSFRLRWSVSAG